MVQELLFLGYTQDRIAQKLNISIRTVAREIKKIRDSSKTWMDNLANTSFIHEYRETLEGIKLDMMYLRETLDEESVKSDIHLRLDILKQISSLRHNYGELLHKGPMVWSIEKVLTKKNSDLIPTPKMPSIWA